MQAKVRKHRASQRINDLRTGPLEDRTVPLSCQAAFCQTVNNFPADHTILRINTSWSCQLYNLVKPCMTLRPPQSNFESRRYNCPDSIINPAFSRRILLLPFNVMTLLPVMRPPGKGNYKTTCDAQQNQLAGQVSPSTINNYSDRVSVFT